MGYRLLTLLTLLAVGLLATAAPIQREDPVKKEKERLQGTWKIVSLKLHGMEAKDPKEREGEFVFKGDKWLLMPVAKGDKEVWLPYKIDVTRKPKEVDLDGIGGTVKGIYELEGDTLKLCLPNPFVSKERPKLLESDRDGKASLIVLKRKKK
jgi:uncharacterized protein (TIGR03067 family)